MSRPAYPLRLLPSIKKAAQRLAKEDGVSLNQWIASAVAQKPVKSYPSGFFPEHARPVVVREIARRGDEIAGHAGDGGVKNEVGGARAAFELAELVLALVGSVLAKSGLVQFPVPA